MGFNNKSRSEIKQERISHIIWNLDGLRTLQNLHNEDESILANTTIISLVETWHTTTLRLPQALNSFKLVERFATREPNVTRGRAKGGLCILYNSQILELVNIVESSNYYIIIRLRNKNSKLIWAVACVYIQSNHENFELVITNLTRTLSDLEATYPETAVIIGGDFNSRTGNLGEFNNVLFENSLLNSARCALDPITDSSGKKLVEIMDEGNYLLLNGRSRGDFPGKHTFSNANGKSTIDLVFINSKASHYFSNLNVLPNADTTHLMVRSEFFNIQHIQCMHQQSNQPNYKLKWDANKKASYANQIKNEIYTGSADELCSTIVIKAASEKLGLLKDINKVNLNNKPWFDGDCSRARNVALAALSNAQKTGFNYYTRMEYINAKKRYAEIRNNKKGQYYLDLREVLFKVRNSKEFWSVVKIYRRNPTRLNMVKEDMWLLFYSEILPPRTVGITLFYDCEHPTLDKPITMSEITTAISSLATGKAPGPDGIPNEFIKNSPTELHELLLQQYNNILCEENPPVEWSESTTVMIHKKGNVELPVNYRPIALLNTQLKLFTQILQSRLILWSENNGILPESQGGLIKSRGCDDQIFTLSSLIQIHTRKNRQLFALFIDFERAFPSINHNKLWDKMFDLGVSGKISRILRKIYDTSYTRVRFQDNKLSSRIEMTEGLLQGEVLSPLLFSLYISDMADILQSSDSSGLKVAIHPESIF
jgi:hypothetical protein